LEKKGEESNQGPNPGGGKSHGSSWEKRKNLKKKNTGLGWDFRKENLIRKNPKKKPTSEKLGGGPRSQGKKIIKKGLSQKTFRLKQGGERRKKHQMDKIIPG